MPQFLVWGAQLAARAVTAGWELCNQIADACNPHYIA